MTMNSRYASVLAVLCAAFLLALPALWNGYPLVYYDTVDYVRMPFTGIVPVFRTASFAMITSVALLNHSLWLIIILECLIVAYILYEALSVFSPIRPNIALVPVTGLLCVLTGLPWFTSQVMADSFTGVIVLGMAALAFGTFRLGLKRQLVLTGVLALVTATHTTHIGIVGGLSLCFVALGFIARRFWPDMRPAAVLPSLVLAGAIVLTALANWSFTNRLFISQPNDVLLLARLVQDGIAKRYLNDVCHPGTKLRLCTVRDRLPPTANDFLWGNSPFHQLGGWDGLKNEAETIVDETLEDYPLLHLTTAIRLTLEQLWMVRTGDGLVNMDWHIRKPIETLYPDDLPQYLNAHQRDGIDFSPLNTVHVPVLLLGSLAVAVAGAAAWRARDRLSAGLCLTVVLALLGNAFICGALSNPLDRYQARIAWAAVFASGIAACRLELARRRVAAPAGTVLQTSEVTLLTGAAVAKPDRPVAATGN